MMMQRLLAPLVFAFVAGCTSKASDAKPAATGATTTVGGVVASQVPSAERREPNKLGRIPVLGHNDTTNRNLGARGRGVTSSGSRRAPRPAVTDDQGARGGG